MNSKIFTAVSFIAFACLTAQVKCGCFDMEKLAKNEKAVEGMGENLKSMVANLCSKEADKKKCMTEKLSGFVCPDMFKTQVTEYIANEAKGTEIKTAIDKCCKESNTDFFCCYFQHAEKICPEMKADIEKSKEKMKDVFECK